MIIVTGTKRSGTSMWMQILHAAGVPVIGERFSRDWEQTIRAANPRGFYESSLRRGVYYATNPDPKTGKFLAPDPTRGVAVKVFIPGLCRTDLAYVSRVVGTMRHWSEYASSIRRLRALEEEARTDSDETPSVERLDPVLEWWLENFALIRDIATRRYTAHLVSYDSVLRDPERTLVPVLNWLGVEGIEAAVAAVSSEVRTQERDGTEEHEYAEVFDALYELVDNQAPVDADFLERLNETHQALVPQIERGIERVVRSLRMRHNRERRGVNPMHPDIMEVVVHGEDDR